MFNYFRKLRNNRRSRAFMIKSARESMQALNMGGQAKLSDAAIESLCVNFGAAYLQGLALGKQLKEGTARLITDLADGAKQEHRLDG
ncbi:MAG: hypothetical protein WC356_01525 [Candidatus Micrarchaeia archaeon]|jgi:hypothetical protein